MPLSTPMRGAEPVQTQDEVDVVRKHIEDELQADRARRQAQADGRPPSDQVTGYDFSQKLTSPLFISRPFSLMFPLAS